MMISRRACCRGLVHFAAIGILLALGAFGVVPVEAATPAIGSGVRHSVALGADGRVRTWGDDSLGALGIGRALSSGRPAAVAGATGIVSVSAGQSHILALRNDRTVVAWGDNANGQIGDGTTTQRSTPVPVTGLTDVVQVAAGGGRSFALKSDGSVWEWGDALVPTRVPGLEGVVEISAGWRFVLARTGDGSVWSWGSNEYGQLGDGTRGEPFAWYPTPRLVRGLANVARIAAGGDHALALMAGGTVRAWGANGRGELGDATTTDRLAPVEVPGLAGIASVAAGYGHSIVFRGDGTALAWGANGYGELGDGTYADRPAPVPLAGLNGATAIATGFLHSVAVMPGGTLVAWGNNERGQLGDPALPQQLQPVEIAGLTGFRAAAVGDLFTVALKADGTVWTWGDNAFGQLGNSAYTFRSTPSTVVLDGVEKMSSGGFHVLALKSDGSVLAWGDSRAAQVGDGTAVNRSSPVPVTGLGPGSAVRDISAGAIHSLALEAGGTVLSWGDNYSSQLGPRSSEDASVPARITGLSDVAAISAGGGHSVALKRDGTVWTWGHNHSGQLGDGTRSALYQGRLAPMAVAGLAGVQAIAAGSSHTVALKGDGTLWAWGANGSGQLGDGTFEDRLVPVQVAKGLTDIAMVAAGDAHTLALRRDGTVWAWGANGDYRLGNSVGVDRAEPVPVAGLNRVVAIAANSHSMALKDDGSVWTWGGNGLGQLGDGTLVNREAPVVVLREGGAGSTADNDWFLDLEPSSPTTIPPDKVPVFLVVAGAVDGRFGAALRYRPEDVGTTGSVFVFALAPATRVKAARDGSRPVPMGKATSRAGAKADSPDCVLAQLDASGSLIAVTAAQLQAAQSGVLSAQGASVNVLNAASSPAYAGTTFYVGYGASNTAMIAGGVYRGVVAVPGTATCAVLSSYTGLWWNAAENGWGINFTHQGNTLFGTLFTYDANRAPLWLVMSGGTLQADGVTFTGELFRTTGPPFDASPFTPITAANYTRVGTMSASFSGVNSGTLTYTVQGASVTKEITRLVYGSRAASCVPVTGSRAGATNYQDLWWNAAEGGWGVNITHQDDTLFATLFTYDATGRDLWLVMSGGARQPDGAYQGTLYRASGPAFDASPFTPITQGDLTNVGTMRLQFADGERGTLRYAVNGAQVDKAITRLVFSSPVSACN